MSTLRSRSPDPLPWARARCTASRLTASSLPEVAEGEAAQKGAQVGGEAEPGVSHGMGVIEGDLKTVHTVREWRTGRLRPSRQSEAVHTALRPTM